MFRSNNSNTPYRGGKRKGLPLVSFALAVSFLGFIIYALIYMLSDTAAAPDQDNIPTPPVIETPAPQEDESTVTAATPEPQDSNNNDEEEDAYVERFTTIQMEISDIYNGYLVLVNQDHAYEIPDDLDLARISDVGSSAIRLQLQGFQLLRSVIEPLDEMMSSYLYEIGDTTVTVIAAWRSYETQRTMRERHGTNASLPGHSEHHTGLAFDFGIFIGSERSMFTGTGNTAWFRGFSHNYGFILRYPADKTEITNVTHEPWHFRYVGLPHSTVMFINNWCLEEYIELLRNHTANNPLVAEVDGVAYQIFFTSDTEVQVPIDHDFEISGNNVDGFIVTAYIPDEFDALLVDAMEGG